ncbi:hypothetical protein ABT300_19980 [Streptomyces sp. NPDC001027]|uniref:hypothetical protein n=1 Tax=Streptomyces sp. NPDC001027 TaxID=3154771 RepID=UPI0033260956
MPVHLTPAQLTALTVLAVASVVWLLVLTRILSRMRARAAAHAALRAVPVLPARPPVVPVLRSRERTGPHRENVELTVAEEDAFAGLVRRLGHGR